MIVPLNLRQFRTILRKVAENPTVVIAWTKVSSSSQFILYPGLHFTYRTPYSSSIVQFR